MRFASMRALDISNGENVGVSLFVQGCPFHCYNCFNPDTWDFNGGKEWTDKTKNQFLGLIDRPYIKRVSLLGGECLAKQNLDDVLSLIKEIRKSFPDKTIWLYTGYTLSDITTQMRYEKVHKTSAAWTKRWEIISMCDVLIDGIYINDLRDVSLKFRGSKNQRVIDVHQTLKQGKVVLYCD